MAGDKLYGFGSGSIFVAPNVTTPTPVKVGDVQDFSVDISWEQKELYGNLQFPVAIARGKGKIGGKFKSAQISGSLINSVMTGSTVASGTTVMVPVEAHTAAASVAITPPNSGTFATDLGVISAAGKQMVRVGSNPAQGVSYTFSNGTYAFNASESGTLLISYTYTLTTGRTLTYGNQLMGSGAQYTLVAGNTEPDGSNFGLVLWAATISKIGLAFKNDDFTMPEMDFTAAAHPTLIDSQGNPLVCNFYF